MPDGATMDVHQRRAAEISERMLNRPTRVVERIDPPPLPPPDGTDHVWRWFNIIASGVNSGGFGFPIVGYVDILAWSVLTGIRPDAWEVTAIVRLGISRASIMNRKEVKPGG